MGNIFLLNYAALDADYYLKIKQNNYRLVIGNNS